MGTVIEKRISIATPPEAISAIYADVSHWHQWDPDTKAATLQGPFAAGVRGTLTPAKGNTVPMVVTFADPQRGFTVASRIPLLLRMVFEHELVPHGPAATEVIHRVTLTGPLAWLIGPSFRRQLGSGLPLTLARLKRLAETGSPNHGA